MSDACVIILQNTKLAVASNICTDVAKSISERFRDEELEVRFGYVLDSKRYSGLAGSNTESSRAMWYRLFGLLQDSKSYKKSDVEKTVSETFGNLRKITDIGTPSIPPVYHEKKPVKSFDILTFNVGSHTHTVRLNRSTEKIIQNASTKGAPDFTRMRTRIAFTSIDGSHRIDLTYTTSPQMRSPSYEVEIEYLRALKDENGRADLKTFFDPIKLVVYIIKSDKELVTTVEYNQAIQVFNGMFVNEARFDPTKLYKRALPQPINLKKQAISLMSGYAVTNKLNGTRMVGVISGGDLYAINMVGNVIKVLSGIPSIFDKTIFDAEYFKDILYIFDILFDKNTDIRGKNLDVRLKSAQTLVDAINSNRVQMKVFKMGPDLERDTIEVLEFNKTLPEEDNDGLIYTPIAMPYFNNGIYKWKPPHMLTIDFAASQIGNGKWLLQVRDNQDKLVKFNPPGFQGIIESKEDLKGIGEYKWTGKTFELVRARPDKDIPNFISIAQDVWEDIQNPISEEELPLLFSKSEKGGRDSIRKYHNSIKRDLINTIASSEFSKGKLVLDLGAGKGGDLSKYQAAKIKTLYAVEPNASFANELKVRADEMKKKHSLGYSLEVIPFPAQDNLAIAEALKGNQVDVAAMFFSLSFFFENNLSLSALIRTLNESIVKGGLFIGTTIDGERVRKVLEEKDKVKFGPVTLEKKYSDFKGDINFNKAIDYIYEDSETVSEKQREYLVDWKLFTNKLEKFGFILEKSDFFAPVDWLNEEEKNITSLYRSFVFKRVTNEVKETTTRVEQVIKAAPSGTNSKFVSEIANKVNRTKKSDEPEYKLCRTGVPGDGNCFFHSILTALKGLRYINLNDKEKMEEVAKLRKQMQVSKEEWMEIWNGNLARLGQEDSPGFDVIFYRFLTEKVSKYLQYRDEIQKALIDDKKIEEFLTYMAGRKYENLSFPNYVKAIKENFPNYIKNKDHQENAIKELDKIIDFAIDESYRLFTENVETCGRWVGQEVLDIVGKRLDIDIYILHDKDGSPYKTECKHLKGRKSIILLFQGGNHYECIGRIHPPGNVIQRIFEKDDHLITAIQDEIC